MRSGSKGLWVTILLLLAFDAQAKTASEVFDTASPSIVTILTFRTNGEAQGLGSGVVLPEGGVATNCHVVEDAATIQVVSQTAKYPAKLRYSDRDRDVCSLSVSGLKAPAVVMGSTSRLRVGERVYALGAPKGLDLTLSEGIISSLRPVAGGQYLQITAPISPGSSGGGLFDEEGRLIGLPTFYLAEGQQLNFAVPVEWISELPRRHAEVLKSEVPLTDWLNRAIALDEKEDWAGLLEHALQWTMVQPLEAVAWNYLGVSYGESSQTNKEIKAYEKALSVNSEFAEAWNNLGIAYRLSGQAVKGIKALQNALLLNPEDAVAWNNLGFAYGEYGQIAKAIEALQQAVEINPGYDNAWLNLGNVYEDFGLTVESIKAYQEAIKVNPEFVAAWLNLGNVYGDSGQIDNAIEAYQQALHINPKYTAAWYNLGIIYYNTGQSGNVIEVYKRLKAIDPVKADKFFAIAVLP